MADTSTIPLFPLGSVLVPGLVLPLHVFEPRYRQLLATIIAADKEAAEQGNPDETIRGFGVPAIREGWEVGSAGVRALHPVGTFARVTQVAPYDDGRYDVVTLGTRRFELVELDTTSQQYLQAEVRWLPEDDGDAAGVLGPSVARRFAAYREAITRVGAEDEAADVDDALAGLVGDALGDTASEEGQLPDDPRLLGYLVTAAMVLDLPDRQALLAAPDVTTRLRLALDLLRRETRILRALPSLPGAVFTRVPISPQ